jgi:hypothetical protein
MYSSKSYVSAYSDARIVDIAQALIFTHKFGRHLTKDLKKQKPVEIVNVCVAQPVT